MDSEVSVSAYSGQHHPQLYFNTVVYAVDDVLFRVPTRYLHKNSEILGAAAQISVGHEGGEGSSDEHPISLMLPYDADSDEFALLIKVVIALDYDLPLPSSYTIDQWLSVLKLSTFWEFHGIRTLAIQNLSQAAYGLPNTLSRWLRFLDFCRNRDEFFNLRGDLISCISQYPFTLSESLSILRFTLHKHDYLDLQTGVILRISKLPPPYAIDEWTPILEFSAKESSFSELRELAISRLSSSIKGDNFTKVELGQKYSVESWFFEGLEALANQNRLPSLGKVKRLGTNIALGLLWLRESKRRGKYISLSDISTLLGKEFAPS
ncbi:hypothetical protein L218DRAFT_512850 [Marasmius fiardii PR-910]|nr:hypothetical protein L218DRAFT_512850 [Marasmius fiardii PR-910]